MTLKIIETYSEGEYTEIEVFQCERCRRTQHTHSGADLYGCPCEFEEEDLK